MQKFLETMGVVFFFFFLIKICWTSIINYIFLQFLFPKILVKPLDRCDSECL